MITQVALILNVRRYPCMYYKLIMVPKKKKSSENDHTFVGLEMIEYGTHIV